MDQDERQAIRQLKEGDIGGLSMLVHRHQEKAIQSACLITGDRALAEDIVQRAFVRAYERIDQFDASRPFEPWFLRSVTNDAIKTLRHRNRHVSFDSGPEGMPLKELLIDSNPGPTAQLDDENFREAVRSALKKLTPKQRAAVVMRYFLEMSETEMSEMMCAPRGTIKSRLHSARNRLRDLLRPLLEWM